MYLARVHLHRFRGYADQVIMPARHAVVVGEPRAGRSDLIMGLRRALDPQLVTDTRLVRLVPFGPGAGGDAADGQTVVEVTLLGLGGDLEQDLDDRLEPIDPRPGARAARYFTSQPGRLSLRVTVGP